MKIWGIALSVAATVAFVAPTVAQADNGRHRGWYKQDRHERQYRRDHYRPRYDARRCRQSSGTTGLILGGAAGALLGREVDRYGDRTPGTIIGAGAGALLGRELDRGGRC